jgi:hypothetical protein
MGDMADLLMDQMWDEYDECPEGLDDDVNSDMRPGRFGADSNAVTYYKTPCKLKHETGKAFLVEIFDREEWFPKSWCKIEDGKIRVPAWLVVKKGISRNLMEKV